MRTDIQLKTWMIFAHRNSLLLSRLSLNILREIGVYLQDCLYPCVYRSTLRVYNFVTGQVTEKAITQISDNGTVYCLYAQSRLVCVGAHGGSKLAFSVCVVTGEVRPLADMMHSRASPGIIPWKKTVYVFGGYSDRQPIQEAEKFHSIDNTWTELLPMSTPKLSFTPLLHLDKIYLIASSPLLTLPIETFDPYTETYQVLNIFIQRRFYGVVSFPKNDEIEIIRSGAKLIRWNISETTYEEKSICLPYINSCMCGAPVVRYKNYVYWFHFFTGRLHEFDLNTGTVVTKSW